MKKIASLLVVTIVLMTACKKEHFIPFFKPDSFLFGKYESNCTCDMIGITFYLINGNHIYEENFLNTLYSKSFVLPDSSYVAVKPLIDHFPAYLLNHPNDTIGCANCTYYWNMLNIVSITGTDTTKWCINPDTTKLPTEIRPYIQQMAQLWDTKLHS